MYNVYTSIAILQLQPNVSWKQTSTQLLYGKIDNVNKSHWKEH